MADVSKLHKRPRTNSLGDPSPPDVASRNLSAPEIAPAPPDEAKHEEQQAGQSVVQLRPAITPPPAEVYDVEEPPKKQSEERAKKATFPPLDEGKEVPRKKRIDGRTLRKTGRNVPLSLHVTAAFDDRLRTIATRDGLLFSVLLEKALEAYEAASKRK